MGIRGTSHSRAALRRLAIAAAAAGTLACNPAFAANQTGTATSVVVRGLRAGTFTFKVTATSNGQTGSATVTLTVTPSSSS